MHKSLAPISPQFEKKRGPPVAYLCGIKTYLKYLQKKYYEPNIE